MIHHLVQIQYQKGEILSISRRQILALSGLFSMQIFGCGGDAVHASFNKSSSGAIIPLSGVVTTIGITGTTLNHPKGVAVNSSGELYISDSQNDRILVVSSGGILDLVTLSQALALNDPRGVAIGPDGSCYVADTGSNRILKIDTSGAVSILPSPLPLHNIPCGLAVDRNDNVYIADSGRNRIIKISSAGIVTTVAGSGTPSLTNGNGMAADFKFPTGVAVDAQGVLYIADAENHVVRKIDTNGDVTTIAGSGRAGFSDGNGTTAQFNYPWGIVLDSIGNIYITDRDNNRIRKLAANGDVTTFAGSGISGLADGPGATAQFNTPTAISIDGNGCLYVADMGNNEIRKIT